MHAGSLIRLPYSRHWLVAGDLFGAMATSNHKQEPNLKADFDSLIAAKPIRAGEPLIAPADFDADYLWKCRMFKSYGWKRVNDSVAAEPSLASYLKYVERAG